MRIGLISDTHHDRTDIKKCIKSMGQVDHIIHAGDNYVDAKYIEKEFNQKVTAVKGNTDMGFGESEVIIELMGRKILVTHGHKYHVKSGYQKLYYKAMEAEVDIVVFGHTHYAVEFKESEILFINPGSASRPNNGYQKSYGILELDEKNVKVELKYFV